MATLRGEIIGGRGEVTREAHHELTALLHTRRTFIDVTVCADGTTRFRVMRDDKIIYSHVIEAEKEIEVK